MTARGIHSCCPEGPSTINVTQNIIQFDGETSFFVNEVYAGTQVIAGVLTLGHTPYQAAAVQVILNSGTQVPTSNYSVVGNRILFNFTPDPSDVIHVRSLKVGENVSVMAGSDMATGTMVGFGSTGTAPDGWLLMDGVSTVTASGHPALHAFLSGNLDLVVGGAAVAGVFTLKEIRTSYYDGTSLVSKSTIIKT